MPTDQLSPVGVAIAAALVLDGRMPIAAYAIAKELDEKYVGAVPTRDLVIESLLDLQRLAGMRTS